MSDYDLPDLPSDEELGITEEERKAQEEKDRAREEKRAPTKRASGGGGKSHVQSRRGGYGWRGPVTLLLLLLLGWATSSQRALPDTVPLAAPDTVFSSGRAMLDLVEIARRAHPPGSPEHARVRAMLVDRLDALGLVPEVQVATSLRRGGEVVSGATVRNVLARVPGTASTGAILLTAHYDSRGISRGAGDDGSGVATILETLRAVRAGPPLRNDLIVLLTDAEELGLLGARAFVEEHPWIQDVAVVLSVEMRGGGGPSNMFETGTDNGWIIGALAAGDPRPFANSMSTEIYRRMPNDTDFSPFRDRGIQGLNFAGLGNAHVYHQAYDSPERFDERTLQHHGLHVLGMVRELGGRDLSDVDGPDRVYFTLPLLGLITYPPAVGYALGMLLLGAVAAVFLLVRRGGLRRSGDTARGRAGGADTDGSGRGADAGGRARGDGGRVAGVVWGVVAGLLLAVAAVAATAAAGHFLFGAVTRFHPEYGSLHGSAFHVEGWYVAAVLAVGVAVTVLGLHLARRRFALGSIALGALTVPLLGALFLTFATPLAAMNLQWPVLLGLVGVALVAGVGPARRPGLPTWIVLLALAAGIAAIAVPLTELLWQALTFEAAAVIGGLVAVWLLLLIPLLDTLREPGGWWAPATGLVAAALFVGVGVLHARPSPERPAPSTLLYVLDRDSAAAAWALGGARAGSAGAAEAEEPGGGSPGDAGTAGAGSGPEEGPADPDEGAADPEEGAADPEVGPADPDVGEGGADAGGVGVETALDPAGAGPVQEPPQDARQGPDAPDAPDQDDPAVGEDAVPSDEGVRWAVARTGLAPAALGPPVPLEAALLGGGRRYRTSPAPVVAIPRPAVSASVAPTPVGADAATSRRRVTVSIHSAAGAEMVAVSLPSTGDVFLEAVNGRPVPDQDPGDRSGARRIRTLVHWGAPPGSAATPASGTGAAISAPPGSGSAAAAPPPGPESAAAGPQPGPGLAADTAPPSGSTAVSPSGSVPARQTPSPQASRAGPLEPTAASGLDGPGVLQLTLDVGPGTPTLEVAIVEHHLRPEELLGERYFLRPPALAPDIVRSSDRAIIRTTVSIDPTTGSVLETRPTRPPSDAPSGAPLDAPADTSSATPPAGGATPPAGADTAAPDTSAPDTSATADAADLPGPSATAAAGVAEAAGVDTAAEVDNAAVVDAGVGAEAGGVPDTFPTADTAAAAAGAGEAVATATTATGAELRGAAGRLRR